MLLRRNIIKLHWFFSSQFGFDPLQFIRSLRGIPLFMKQLLEFRKKYTGTFVLKPCLHDRCEESGTTTNEYFWQDLHVARLVHDAHPQKHVDVGSRVDGFVAHVASFREIEVFDVRPITSNISGIVFKQADMMGDITLLSGNQRSGYCDSLSCLHAIEHFGLGRYGDPVTPHGYVRGIANMAQLLKPGGTFYLSTPIGQERVEFNANYVFDPKTIMNCAKSSGLELQELTVISSDGLVRKVQLSESTLHELAQFYYHLGIFIFIKKEV
jgi:SAM-dependent methyltransferase